MNRTQQRQQGFTLLEVLVVIGIIGILSSVLYLVSRPYLIRQQTAEAASQVAQSLERMRSIAAKTSQPAGLIVNSAHPTYYKTYQWKDDRLVFNQVTVPNGAQLFFRNGRNYINYTPPYAEVSATNRTLYINPKGTDPTATNGEYTREIYIVGVTGKVHQ